MGFYIECPNCGSRSYHEFHFGGELRPYEPEADVDRDYTNVWLRDNLDGPQVERWFHHAGCRRWLTIERDTRTNTVLRRLPTEHPSTPNAS
jgi:heterotetrameric sarcosine oxidase delta subunit